MANWKAHRWRRPVGWLMTAGLAIALAGCGGGGGSSGGGSVAVAPSPTPTPAPTTTPTPTPTPPPGPRVTVLSIGAPALATAPASPASPQASLGGPNFLTQPTPSIAFPVLQSTLRVIDTFNDGPVLVADEGTMNLGASFDFAFCSGCRETFALSVPSLGLSKVSLSTFDDTPFHAALDGQRELGVEEATWGFRDLASLKFGYWEIRPLLAAGGGCCILDFPVNHSSYVYGYETPVVSLPTTGVVTYTGRVVGRYFQPSPRDGFPALHRFLSGTASIRVDFARRTAMGQLSNLMIGDGVDSPGPWIAAIPFSASFASGPAHLTGTTAVAAGASTTGFGAATGTIAARFYGADAQELGLVWTLHDGTTAALGSIGARR